MPSLMMMDMDDIRSRSPVSHWSGPEGGLHTESRQVALGSASRAAWLGPKGSTEATSLRV